VLSLDEEVCWYVQFYISLLWPLAFIPFYSNILDSPKLRPSLEFAPL
jgi:hypothetical protein